MQSPQVFFRTAACRQIEETTKQASPYRDLSERDTPAATYSLDIRAWCCSGNPPAMKAIRTRLCTSCRSLATYSTKEKLRCNSAGIPSSRASCREHTWPQAHPNQQVEPQVCIRINDTQQQTLHDPRGSVRHTNATSCIHLLSPRIPTYHRCGCRTNCSISARVSKTLQHFAPHHVFQRDEGTPHPAPSGGRPRRYRL